MTTRSMISFDWAMKRLLRNKANFEVLEGFLSELLERKIIINNIAESEGNRSDKADKTNRVDILVEADGKEMVIIELQYDSEDDYFQRMLYGVSKVVTEHINSGIPYSKIRKVYSVNIVYFDLGKGDDYVYRGGTNFVGIHTGNELHLTEKQHGLIVMTRIENDTQYKWAVARVEELLPMIDDQTPRDDPKSIELELLSNLVADYSDVHFTIGTPALVEAIKLRMYEMKLTKKALANMLGVSPARMNKIITGNREPTYHIARDLSKKLDIDPSIVLGVC